MIYSKGEKFMREILITYDLDSKEQNYRDFKKEVIRYFEGQEREIEDWLPDTTVIVKIEDIKNMKDFDKIGNDFGEYLDQKEMLPTHMVLSVIDSELGYRHL